MPAVDVPLLPVIVTERPDSQDGARYQQPPTGTDPGALRIVAAADVQAGDWVLGDCEQPVNSRRALYWGVHATSAFPALPVTDSASGRVALDGRTPNWRAEELVMVIPRPSVPPVAFRTGDRVEATGVDVPRDGEYFPAGRPRPVLRRGTVAALHRSGMVEVDWGAGTSSPAAGAELRHVEPGDAEAERRSYGFAIGDRIARPGSPTAAVVLEVWHHWANYTPMLRAYWPATGERREGAAAGYVPAPHLL